MLKKQREETEKHKYSRDDQEDKDPENRNKKVGRKQCV